jgi:hypothetical protein
MALTTVRVHLLESIILQLLVRQTLMVMLLEVSTNNYRNFIGISSTGAVTTCNINSNQLGNASGGLITLKIQVT